MNVYGLRTPSKLSKSCNSDTDNVKISLEVVWLRLSHSQERRDNTQFLNVKLL